MSARNIQCIPVIECISEFQTAKSLNLASVAGVSNPTFSYFQCNTISTWAKRVMVFVDGIQALAIRVDLMSNRFSVFRAMIKCRLSKAAIHFCFRLFMIYVDMYVCAFYLLLISYILTVLTALILIWIFVASLQARNYVFFIPYIVTKLTFHVCT